MAYIDKVYESFADHFRSPTRTKEKWLDGQHGWREPLRQIGRVAARITTIHNPMDARREWYSQLKANPWMREYLSDVPLLYNTATTAHYDNPTFQQYMKDLATLATL